MVCMVVEISGDVTDAGRTPERQTRENRATQPMYAGWLSFAIKQDKGDLLAKQLHERVLIQVIYIG